MTDDARPADGAPGLHRRAGALAGRMGRKAGRHLETTFGGRTRTQVIVVLAAVLALSSADIATVGAAATQLRSALHISDTDIGLLVGVSAVVAAVASLPFGVLTDRFNRVRLLGGSIILWAGAMVWSATAANFDELLLARLFLGFVTAISGPAVASLVGDYFPSSERGRVYGWILTGELLGAGIGFSVTGDIAAISWRAGFVVLALPTLVLAYYTFRLPEPARGGGAPLRPETTSDQPSGEEAPASWADVTPAGAPPSDDATTVLNVEDTVHQETDAQRLARLRGVDHTEELVTGYHGGQMGLVAAVKYLLSIPTNVTLIIASACGYFYLSGVETFGVEFSKEQFGVAQAVANGLLLVVGVGAVVGVLVAGTLSDSLLRKGHLNSRVLIAGFAALATVALFVPALLTRSPLTALPYLTVAACMLAAQNPPIDAARLDIVPGALWGRAEGLRTALRTAAQSLAPVIFGAVSDHVFGGGRSGMQLTFLVMLLPLLANGYFLLKARHSYPRDVATAAEATFRAREEAQRNVTNSRESAR